jgi:hypothetical protein
MGFWHSLNVIGHQYETSSNKLIVYFPDGGLREIAHWSDCELLLGSDWSKLINDDSGNVDFVKEKLIDQQKIKDPIEEIRSREPPPKKLKSKKKKNDVEKVIDDRDSSSNI